MTSQTRQQTITIHILSNISKRDNNETIKLDQLIGYKMRKIFLEIS